MDIRENEFVILISRGHTVRTSKGKEGKEVDRVVNSFQANLGSNLRGENSIIDLIDEHF